MDAIALATLIVPVLGLLLSFYFNFYRQRPEKKALTVNKIYDSSAKDLLEPLLRRAGVVANLLSKDIRVTELEIKNTGNTEIRMEDFEQLQPLSISFEGEGEILDFDIKETQPRDLDPQISRQDSTQLRIEPCLLNPNDVIRLEILSSYPSDLPLRARARIAGIKEVAVADLTTRPEIALESYRFFLMNAVAALATAAAVLASMLVVLR